MTVEALEALGMERMTDDEVESYLSGHSQGVLGLATEEAPYLLPMSYGYDGGESVYFFFIQNDESQKADLAAAVEIASFLVYSVETMFSWRSVQLSGTLHQLSDERRSDLTEAQMPGWRPELFEQASEIEGTGIYEFSIEEWTGYKHTGLPPGLFDVDD